MILNRLHLFITFTQLLMNFDENRNVIGISFSFGNFHNLGRKGRCTETMILLIESLVEYLVEKPESLYSLIEA